MHAHGSGLDRYIGSESFPEIKEQRASLIKVHLWLSPNHKGYELKAVT